MKNCKIFRYRGKKYIVSEMEVAKDWFKSVCFKKDGTTHCIIQSALSGAEKQKELHRLINGDNLRGILSTPGGRLHC